MSHVNTLTRRRDTSVVVAIASFTLVLQESDVGIPCSAEQHLLSSTDRKYHARPAVGYFCIS